MNNKIHLQATVPPEFATKRLDQALALLFPEHSRSRLKDWVEKEQVMVNGKHLRPKDKVLGGEIIEIQVDSIPVESWAGEAIPLDIIHEDSDILIINKPPNLVVHPATGNRAGTLVNALLHYLPELNYLPRAGIVHRLDKDTSGLLVVAKTLSAHTHLVAELQSRKLKREYEAIVWGVMPSGGSLKTLIGRHPIDRKRMAVTTHAGEGKEAITHYRVIKRYPFHSHLQINLETGRTHQIRVHMAHISYPIVGDKTYGGRLRTPKGASVELINLLRNFPRQALHARRLGLIHPLDKEFKEWEAPLPLDMQALIKGIEKG